MNSTKGDNTPTNTLEEVKEAVKDGLSNHSGEFANPWIFKGSYSHELLADILNDIMNSERLFKNLEKLIADKVAQAVNKADIKARISTLKSLPNSDEDETVETSYIWYLVDYYEKQLETPNQVEKGTE